MITCWRRFQEQQKVVELGERFVSFVDAGCGRPVVLLHGAPTWGFLYHRMLPLLQTRRRVLVPDLPGYGFSDRSDRFGRGLSRQTERLAAWLQAVGVERAAFVGHDLGAALALRYAALHPERVESLVLISAAAYDGPAIPGLADLALGPGFERKLVKALEPGFAVPQPDSLEGLLAPYGTNVGRLSLARGAAALDAGERMELAEQLPRVRSSSLVVWGEKDPFRPLEHGRRLAWDLPHAKLSVLADASHFSPLEKEAELAALVTGFLEAPSLN
jgi:pimeloyl-ACP methyl ester carboxylesterase